MNDLDFNEFSYYDNGHYYTAQNYEVGTSGIIYDTIKVYFENGKIHKIDITSENGTSTAEFLSTDFTISLPSVS